MSQSPPPLIDRSTVLVLNRHWVAIDTVTPVEAFGHLATGSARAVFIAENAMQALDWEDWRSLPAGDGADSIGTPRGRVRIPTVIVLSHYGKVPIHYPKFGFRALWDRDGGRCQYSGRKLTPAEANIDHVLPRSRGGGDDWENCVISDRALNSRKGARTPSEAGLRLLNPPRAPKAQPANFRIRNLWNIPDWNHFLQLPA